MSRDVKILQYFHRLLFFSAKKIQIPSLGVKIRLRLGSGTLNFTALMCSKIIRLLQSEIQWSRGETMTTTILYSYLEWGREGAPLLIHPVSLKERMWWEKRETTHRCKLLDRVHVWLQQIKVGEIWQHHCITMYFLKRYAAGRRRKDAERNKIHSQRGDAER